ncbi:MAG: rhomboid family intramembrane serine protease [Rubripirellula sp.]|nr:rhomboid family intramembrane serine protease [Rubripirellula sp.]
MDAGSSEREAIVKTKNRNQCLEYRFVLDAVGIRSHSVRRDGWWWLEVRADDANRALLELDAYREENSDVSVGSQAVSATYDYAVAGTVVYGLILIAIAILDAYRAYGIDWVGVGQMNAGTVRDGEWWRSATALTLHVDVGHLMSNLVFGVVFGFMAGRALGGGVAWLAIVIAGTLGNSINALIQDRAHTSIGASTAVFSALGLLVANALRHWGDKSSRWIRWRPLIGGVVLLGFTGVGGERTDVAAHFTGFLAGLAIGWLGCRISGKVLSNANVQQVAGVAAIAMIVIAWWVATR